MRVPCRKAVERNAGGMVGKQTGQGIQAAVWTAAWAYLSLEVKGQHGKAEVEHEVLGLEALQGPAHPEGHHAFGLNEDHGADHVEGTD